MVVTEEGCAEPVCRSDVHMEEGCAERVCGGDGGGVG